MFASFDRRLANFSQFRCWYVLCRFLPRKCQKSVTKLRLENWHFRDKLSFWSLSSQLFLFPILGLWLCSVSGGGATSHFLSWSAPGGWMQAKRLWHRWHRWIRGRALAWQQRRLTPIIWQNCHWHQTSGIENSEDCSFGHEVGRLIFMQWWYWCLWEV